MGFVNKPTARFIKDTGREGKPMASGFISKMKIQWHMEFGKMGKPYIGSKKLSLKKSKIKPKTSGNISKLQLINCILKINNSACQIDSTINWNFLKFSSILTLLLFYNQNKLKSTKVMLISILNHRAKTIKLSHRN